MSASASAIGVIGSILHEAIDDARRRSVIGEGDAELVIDEARVYDIIDALDLRTPRRTVFDARDLLDPDFEIPILVLHNGCVYIKLMVPGLLHKTEIGAVQRVVADDLETIRSVAEDMMSRVAEPQRASTRIMIVDAVDPAVSAIGPLELWLGARTTHDFGPVIGIGPGGIAAKFWADRLKRAYGPVIGSAIDLSPECAKRMVERCAFHELWSGAFRGGPLLIDDEIIERWILAWARLITWFDGSKSDRLPEIVEAEINPLVFCDQEAIPLDGLMRVRIPDKSCLPLSEIGDQKSLTRSQRVEGVRRLLHAETIAIAGVSARKMNPGRIILQNLLQRTDHPTSLAVIKPGCAVGETIDQVPCYASIRDLPHKRIDLYVAAVDAAGTIDLLDDVDDRVAAMQLVAGGTSETTQGADLGEALRERLDRRRLVAIGPNCLGLISRPANLDTLFLPQTKLPRGELKPAPLAYISQSGAFMITRINRMPNLPPRYAISTGNEMSARMSEVVEAVVSDSEVRVVGLYVEGFSVNDGQQLRQVIETYGRQGKAFVVYKAGRTQLGAVAASGHTASIAGDAAVCRAILEQAGAIVVESFPEFEASIRLAVGWSTCAPPMTSSVKEICYPQARLSMVSNAGYETVAVADALRPPLVAATWARDVLDDLSKALVAGRIAALVNVRNPLDLTPMANRDVWASVTETLLATDESDVLVISPVPPTPALATLPRQLEPQEDLEDPNELVAVFGQLVGRYPDRRIIFNVDCGRRYDPFAEAIERRTARPVFRSIDDAIAAIHRYASRIKGVRQL